MGSVYEGCSEDFCTFSFLSILDTLSLVHWSCDHFGDSKHCTYLSYIYLMMFLSHFTYLFMCCFFSPFMQMFLIYCMQSFISVLHYDVVMSFV